MKKATMKNAPLGEKLCALVLSHQLGISIELAWKKYVREVPIDPSWHMAGECLLRSKYSNLGVAFDESEASAEEEERPTPGSAHS